MSTVCSLLSHRGLQLCRPSASARPGSRNARPAFRGTPSRSAFAPALPTHHCRRPVQARASSEQRDEPTPFGYTRKDAIIIGVGLIGAGFGLKYGLELAGIPDLQAGVYAELAVFLFLCFGWVSTYIFRVATKKMTYAQQLQQYEEAVMKKRLEEMTEEELKALEADLEQEKKGL